MSIYTKKKLVWRGTRQLLRIAKFIIFIAIGYISYKVIGTISGKDTTLVRPERTTNLQEAKKLFYSVTVGNTDFNIPILYGPYNPPGEQGWIVPDTERKLVDVIRMTAVLPDLDYYNERTAGELRQHGKGYGKKVTVLIKEAPTGWSWQYYFDYAYKRLIKLPEEPKLPGMFHFRDPLSDNRDVYLSYDKPVRDLTQIICFNPALSPKKIPFPSCDITTIYRDQFLLEYHYQLEFIGQWAEIDRKLKTLLDSFIPSHSINKGDIP